MAVDVLDHGQRRVAEDLGKLDRVHPPGQRPGCIGVAKQVRVDTLLDGESIKQMMRKANKVGAAYALLIGSEEQQKHEVTVKNMITGEQLAVKQSELVNYFKK